MQWEYKTTTLDLPGIINTRVESAKIDAMLNQLGRDGWELVSTFLLQKDMAKPSLVCFLKRPLQPADGVATSRGVCPQCSYDLRGADHDSCPECGWRVE